MPRGLPNFITVDRKPFKFLRTPHSPGTRLNVFMGVYCCYMMITNWFSIFTILAAILLIVGCKRQKYTTVRKANLLCILQLTIDTVVVIACVVIYFYVISFVSFIQNASAGTLRWAAEQLDIVYQANKNNMLFKLMWKAGAELVTEVRQPNFDFSAMITSYGWSVFFQVLYLLLVHILPGYVGLSAIESQAKSLQHGTEDNIYHKVDQHDDFGDEYLPAPVTLDRDEYLPRSAPAPLSKDESWETELQELSELSSPPAPLTLNKDEGSWEAELEELSPRTRELQDLV